MTENNSGSNGREEMASKAHAAVQEDEFATANGKKVRIKIFRGDSEGGKEVEYEIPAVEGMVVLDAVLTVQAYQAQDLAVRWNCKAAHCGSCSAEINGRPKLLCKSRVDEYEGQEIKIQPMRAFPVVKDLVSDVSWNYNVSATIPPFNPGEEQAPFTMYEEDVERLYEPKSCIECFMCRTSATCCVRTTSTPSSRGRAFSCARSGWRCTRSTRTAGCTTSRRTRAGWGTATSPSVAPRCVRPGSRSPTTPSSP
jgi:succinate dehydrogenase / fumarate reductase iron-sulfur subunit